MNWLARLSFAQALRWALLWPALVLAVVLGAAAFVAAALWWRGNWVIALNFQSRGPLPVWLAVAVVVAVVLAGPPALFLALWRAVRR